MAPSQLLLPLLMTASYLGQVAAVPINGKRQASAVPSYVVDYGKSIS